MAGYRIKKLGCLLMATALAVAGHLSPSLVQAQQTAAQATFYFDIPSKPVTQAISDIARTSGLAVVFVENRAITAQGRPIQGSMTVEHALVSLLSGTGLSHRFSDEKTLQIVESPVAAGATRLAPVVVYGESEVTEGSGSYRADVTTIGKIPRGFRETPNTVSVVTRQQMDDQGLNSVQEVLAVTNGATLLRNDDSNERTQFQFRGFATDSVQVDGSSSSGNYNVMMFDTAIYDRVEVLKGPAGILQGAREPGGTINLVRKRATSQRQIKLDATTGSWSQRRADIDAGGPLNESGSVRGRLVGVWDKGDSFIDLVNHETKLLYGTLDLDITNRTSLTLGSTWQEGDGRNSRGLPAYADGRLLDVSRGTYAGADWNFSTTRSMDAFAKLEHQLQGGGTFGFSANYLDRERNGKLAYSDSPFDPDTGTIELRPENRVDREENLTLDTYVSLPFMVGGLTHTVLFGADYTKSDEEEDLARSPNIPLSLLDRNNAVPEPAWNFNRFDLVKNEQYGVYSQAQLKPTQRSTLVLGGRLSWWKTRSSDRHTGEEDSRASVNSKFTPYAGGIIDVTDTASLYASYASIFVPQSATTSDNSVIDPRKGKQYEVGVKQELFEGAANASLAAFQIEDSNRAVGDPANPDYSVATGKARSRGLEAEINGELAPFWQAVAGYTYLTTRYLEDPENEGAAFEPRAPRHSLRLWTKYSFESGALQGLSVGGGVTTSSDVYRIDGGSRFSQGGYTLLSLQLGYRINDHLRASLAVTNLFDKKYYQSVGYADRQNYYGEPSAVTFKLSSSF